MTLLLIVAVGWLLTACLTAAFLTAFARSVRRWAYVTAMPVHVPLQRSSSAEVPSLEAAY